MTDFNLSLLDSKEQVLRISSREVAELMGRRHDQVLRDIRAILAQGCAPHNFVDGTYKDKNNQERPCFFLTKEGCFILVMKEDALLREKVVNRWVELERAQAKQPMFPRTYVEALEQFVAQVKENERLALENKVKQTYIEENEENVQFAKQCAVSTSSISMEEFSKELYKKHNFRLGKNQCYKWFRDKGYLRDNNLPYQQYLNRGWFEVQKTQSWKKDGTCFTFPLVYIKDTAQQMFFYEILNDSRTAQMNKLF